jgi:hypothetical protein
VTNLATDEQPNAQDDTPSRSPVILRPYVHCEPTHNGPIASTLLRICYTSPVDWLAANSPLWRRWTAECYSAAARGGEIHASHVAQVVVENAEHRIKVEEARKWRIPLSVDGTGQSGPQLVAQMREPASAKAKTQHVRAEVEHGVELRRSEGRSLVWLSRWSLTVLCKWWSWFSGTRFCVSFARDLVVSNQVRVIGGSNN